MLGETFARSPPLAVPAPVSPITTGWLGRRLSVWRWCGTLLLARHPELFRAILKADLARELAKAASEPMVARLNVVSDVAWERECPELFTYFPTVRFMDYTKDISRVLDPNRPANYHLTFSRSEVNEAECRRAPAAGFNVTVVFRKPPYPSTFWGYPVIDGDQNDLRFLDPSPCIIALKAKGAGGRRDASGFVLHQEPVNREADDAAGNCEKE